MKCYNCSKEIKAQPNNKINIYNNKLYCENCYNKLIQVMKSTYWNI